MGRAPLGRDGVLMLYEVIARCEKCLRVWMYDSRERFGADRPHCPYCEKTLDAASILKRGFAVPGTAEWGC
jgi:hypothetical protein